MSNSGKKPAQVAPGAREAATISAAPVPKLEITGSRQFTAWLAEQRASLAFTTYQAGKLFLIGLKEDGRLSVFERSFERCMGLAVHDNGFYLASLYQLWRFNNVLAAGQNSNGFDRLYVPQMCWVTGDVDCHDIGIARDGRPVFVNTLFSCLATVDESASFAPVWQPGFISKLAAEDRCHLNGLAIEDGRPRYVTAVSRTDVNEGWREHRVQGGVVIDVDTQQVVCEGLSMPHSPRLHMGKLWLLDSGKGQFGYIDLTRGVFEPVCFCPGYARGLAFSGPFAVIGLSKPRGENKTFQGLPLDGVLAAKRVGARCGLQIVDLRTGDAVHQLMIDGVVEELYDVALLLGVLRPSALGFKTDEIRRVLSLGTPQSLD
jgi:uncharacterized protein (TIGR03032 family)